MKQVKFFYNNEKGIEERINEFLKNSAVYNPEFHMSMGDSCRLYVMIVYETESGYRESAR